MSAASQRKGTVPGADWFRWLLACPCRQIADFTRLGSIDASQLCRP
jgi:hypothetical protein